LREESLEKNFGEFGENEGFGYKVVPMHRKMINVHILMYNNCIHYPISNE